MVKQMRRNTAQDLTEVLQLLEEKKGRDTVVMDAKEITVLQPICEYMVIVTCTSHRHMSVVSNHLVEHFALKGMLLEYQEEDGRYVRGPPVVEGPQSELWMLVNLEEIVVHVMTQDGRDHYQLESHWRYLQAARDAKMPLEEYLASIGRELGQECKKLDMWTDEPKVKKIKKSRK